MNSAEFHAEFLRDHAPAPEQIAVVDALLALYACRGLLPRGRDEPLYEVCPNSESCWEGATRPVPDHAGISVPWVGREYAAWRVCVVGLNFDNYGGLAGHWRVCASHIRTLRDGGLGKNGRFFATGAMSYARAVEMSMCGSLGGSWDDPSPADLARSWERCAYLQAVKCAPHGNRSQPTRAMCSACPPFLLKEELEILAPSAVILLGRTSVRDIVRPMLSVRWGESPGHFERDEFVLDDGRSVQLFCCNHPSTPNRSVWRASLDELTESLRSNGLSRR
jgi:hypothetical protein